MAIAWCAVRPFRSKPALAASLVLLLAFFFVTRIAIHWRSSDGAIAQAVLYFLHPGYKHHPLQWLAIEGSVLLAGACGLLLYGVALAQPAVLTRLKAIPSVVRRADWRPIVWALLLGYLAPTLLSAVFLISDFGSPWRRGGLAQAMHFAGYVAPLGTLYCAARLLFGRRPWRADKWLGYITAAAALFGVSWKFIMVSGLGESLPLAGLVGARGAASAHTLISLAVGIASVWTGLVLARNGEAALRGLRDFAVIGYLVLAASLISVLLSKIASLGYVLSSLSGQYSAPYLCLLTAFAGVVILCLADGAGLLAGGTRPAVPAETARPARSLFRCVLAATFTSRFLADFGLSLVITVVLLGIAYMTVGQTPLLAAAFMMPIIIFGFLIGPIVMFVIGVLRGRAGFAAAPVLILLAIFGFRYANLQVAAHRAEAAVEEAGSLNVYPFATPSRQHDVLVIEGAYDSRPEGNCQAACQQILLGSHYAVAYAEQESGQWRTYRIATGADFCRQPAQVKSYLEMIALRRLDTCLAMTYEAPRLNALVIREDYALDLPIKKQLPANLRASVTEFYERIDGKDRLLGRIVSGNVQPPLISDQQPTKTELQLSGTAFYASALKLPLSDQYTRGDADLAAVVATYETLFTDAIVGNEARDRFRLFGGKTEAEVAPKRTAILRFWDSNDPDSIKLGLRSLYHIRNFGLDFAKPGVARFLAADDPDVMKAAVSALIAFDKDIEFAKEPLAELILSGRAGVYGEKSQGLSQVLKNVPGGYAEPARERAKARLAATGSDTSSTELLGLLSIVARGSAGNRQEATDWIFSLEGERFERAVLAAREEYEALAQGSSVLFWSDQELAMLAARAGQVSDANLYAYVHAFRHQMAFNTLEPDIEKTIKTIVDQRIAALENGSKEDRHIALNLKQLSEKLDR